MFIKMTENSFVETSTFLRKRYIVTCIFEVGMSVLK